MTVDSGDNPRDQHAPPEPSGPLAEASPFDIAPTPSPDARDIAAAKLIDAYSTGELGRVRASAEKWTTGLGAVVTVVSTVTVLKGKDSFDDLIGPARIAVIAAIVVAGLALGYGVLCSYRAAIGSPTRPTSLDELASTQGVLEGTADAWRSAVNELVSSARKQLTHATHATLAAASLLAIAVAITWLAPTKVPTSKLVCVRTGGELVTLSGPLPTVVSGSLNVVACHSKAFSRH